MESSPKECKSLIAGTNPVAVDMVCSELMGFDFRKIPTFKYAINTKKYKIYSDIDTINILSDRCDKLEDVGKYFNNNFIPSMGWKGHIEKEVIQKSISNESVKGV